MWRDGFARRAAFFMGTRIPNLISSRGSIMQETEAKQLLYMVMGGRVADPRNLEFQDPESIHVAGVFSDYEGAEDAWRSNAQRTVDDAEMKYVIVPLHKILEPEE